ncbi:MAG TPA: NAD(P)-binding domain-containing protein, partial [Actinomycetota bacterium]|nr:NAD(P)-binding domain-containing protein [Actinomycetota bacterium]
MTKLAVLGAGKMGEALIAGLVASGWRKPEDIVATARTQERLDALAGSYGVQTTLSNPEAVAGAQVVVLAVKPQDAEALLADVSPHVGEDHTLLSVVAAISTAFIESHLAGPVPVVRAMPNTPSIVHEGMAGIAGGKHATDEHVGLAREVLTHVCRVAIFPERYL